MEKITIYSFLGLAGLYLLSEICAFLFKIRSQKFYAFFHFAGGALSYLFVESLIKNSLLSLLVVFLIGIWWEIYEWIRWKYFLKKRIFRPERKDTVNDLFVDILGAMTILVLRTFIGFKV